MEGDTITSSFCTQLVLFQCFEIRIVLTNVKAEELDLELDPNSAHLITPPPSLTFEQICMMQLCFSLTDENHQLAPFNKRRVHFHLPNPHLSAEIPWIKIIVHKETRVEEAGDDDETVPSIVVHTGCT